jgi:hypothetical protein
VEKELTEREIANIFNVSIMTQVDELYTGRIFEMNYVEYLEVLGRLADKVSLCSLYYKEEEEIANCPKAERDEQPLCLKIEALLVKLMNTVVPWHSVMKYYKIPKDSSFTKTGKILEYEEWSSF